MASRTKLLVIMHVDKKVAQKRQSILIKPLVLTRTSYCWNQHNGTLSCTIEWYTQNEILKLTQRTIK